MTFCSTGRVLLRKNPETEIQILERCPHEVQQNPKLSDSQRGVQLVLCSFTARTVCFNIRNPPPPGTCRCISWRSRSPFPTTCKSVAWFRSRGLEIAALLMCVWWSHQSSELLHERSRAAAAAPCFNYQSLTEHTRLPLPLKLLDIKLRSVLSP